MAKDVDVIKPDDDYDKTYSELKKKVLALGHFSGLSKLINFIVFGERNWLEITWGGTALRLDIKEDEIHLCYSSDLYSIPTGGNALTVRRLKNWDAEKGQWLEIESAGTDDYGAHTHWCSGCRRTHPCWHTRCDLPGTSRCVKCKKGEAK